MREAKKKSKGWKYNGILGFYPFINKKNYPTFCNPSLPALSFLRWGTIFDWSTHFNKGMCLSDLLINRTDKLCEDANIYLMVFYFKGRLNWK